MCREEGYPVLISLSGLYERTGSPFQKERIGYSKLRQRKERRIGIGRDNCVEEKPSHVVITFANFVRGNLKKLSVASRRNRVGQLCVLVVAASAAEDAKEFSFLLLVSLLCGCCGSRGRSSSSVACCACARRCLKASLHARVQIRDRGFELIQVARVKLVVAVHLAANVVHLFENGANLLIKPAQTIARIVRVSLFLLLIPCVRRVH